jgi:hypothetical protein
MSSLALGPCFSSGTASNNASREGKGKGKEKRKGREKEGKQM